MIGGLTAIWFEVFRFLIQVIDSWMVYVKVKVVYLMIDPTDSRYLAYFLHKLQY